MKTRSAPLARKTPLKRTQFTPKATPDPVSPEVRVAVMRRAGGRCEIAGPGCTGTARHVHHRKRRAHGDHREVNLIASCSTCHTMGPKAIHVDVVASYANGWLVRATLDPADVPWLRRGEMWNPHP